MSGAMGELTHGGLNREQDETIQQLCQPEETLRFSSSGGHTKRCDSAALAAVETLFRSPVDQREDNEKSLSQL
jgi:hypothetical protein